MAHNFLIHKHLVKKTINFDIKFSFFIYFYFGTNSHVIFLHAAEKVFVRAIITREMTLEEFFTRQNTKMMQLNYMTMYYQII